jgi:PKD repeat protein
MGCLLVVAGPRQYEVALAQVTGPLQLELSVSPLSTTPGHTLQLDVRLTNQAQTTHTPEVTLALPKGLSLQTRALPSGVTLNLRSNSLSWLPIVGANGGVQQVSLQLRVETADITQVEQVITAVLRHEGSEQNASATIWIGIPPQVHTLLTPSQAAVGQPIQLRAEVAGSGPFSQRWDLGDGRQVEVNDPVVVYPAAGIYEITLTASNPLTAVSHSKSITVVPHPAAQFVLDDTTPGVGQSVAFLNQSGGQPPLVYSWDFGDGVTAGEANPSHAYTSPGVYQAHLTVQNSYGRSEAFWPVTVGMPPTADMVLSESAIAGQAFHGQAFGDQSVTRFYWDMGDGHAYEGDRVSHIYGQSGDYYVTMTADNGFGLAQVGRWLYVAPGILSVYLPSLLNLPGLLTAGPANDIIDPLGITLEPVELSESLLLERISFPANVGQAEQLFYYLNEARRLYNLPSLNLVSELNTVAQQHGEDMSTVIHAGHIGSDGSLPAERFIWHGYASGYAGEATAWGFAHAYEAVEFWVNSPSHRSIIFNRFATDVGVGFTLNYSAPNIWYWTAEFGNALAAPLQPAIRLQEPLSNLDAFFTTPVPYSWNWPARLAPDQQFVVYLYNGNMVAPIGTVAQPVAGSRYTLETAVSDLVEAAGVYEWQVRLEDGNGTALAESERRALNLSADPNLPTPTPTMPALIPTLTATPTVTPTPTIAWPTATPQPPNPTPPILITATPLPTP